MSFKLKSLYLAAALAAPCLLVAAQTGAQTPPPAAPAGAAMPHGIHKAATHDPADAPAGVYVIDPTHASFILRVMHEGRSFSTFRFGGMQGAVDWNPAQPEASKVEVTVETKSIMTPVPGFVDNLTGTEFLNS